MDDLFTCSSVRDFIKKKEMDENTVACIPSRTKQERGEGKRELRPIRRAPHIGIAECTVVVGG